jgi:hypothetical protein
MTSIGASSPMRMGRFMHEKKKDNLTFSIATIWWDAPESKIHVAREDLMEINA